MQVALLAIDCSNANIEMACKVPLFVAELVEVCICNTTHISYCYYCFVHVSVVLHSAALLLLVVR